MKATNWEFAHRATIFGAILGVSFSLYALDPQNTAAVMSRWLAARCSLTEDQLAHCLLAGAAGLLAAAALIRTWASAYLHASVVYAAEVKSASLVADGPYRRVRNPLYFANVLMAVGFGPLMSRSGYVVVVVAMLVFCYRLIMREESELQASQGEMYERYRQAVPRLWPALAPRTAAAGRRPNWGAGFKAECWYWGIAASVAAFAVTLNFTLFLIILGASIALFWVTTTLMQKKNGAH
jgi:protein-S-isoprenylcysteine O-methyltransferase Ste14